MAVISVDPRGDGRAAVTVAHERLPEAGEVARWKAYGGGGWLDAVDGSGDRRVDIG